MSNPLVAQAQSQTTGVTGIGIAESAVDLANGVSDGSWVEAGLGAVGVGLEVLSLVVDPIGTLASYGVSWLIEHVQPLKEALDWLAGDPPVIQSFSETWANVAAEVNAIAGDLGNEVTNGTAGWQGEGGDAYRGAAAEQADALAGAASLADGISAGVMIMGTVVAAVRELVRDLVAELVGKLITWALEAAGTLGFATPVIAVQATTAITKTISKISEFIRKLVKTIGNVSPKIKKIIDKLGEIIEKLSKMLRRGGKPGGGTTPSSAKPGTTKTPDTSPNSPDTTPSGTDTTPDGTDTPGSKSPDGNGNGNGNGNGPDGKPLKDQAGDPQTAGRDTGVKEGCGDPVDPATGEMFTVQTDVRLQGVLPLVLERGHTSGYRAGRSFGRTWSSTFDQRLEIADERVYYAAPDGAILVYPSPPAGGTTLPVAGARWPLTRDEDGRFSIRQPQQRRVLHFAPGDGATLPIARLSDYNGNRIDFEYAADGQVTGVRHSGGYHVRVDSHGGLITGLSLLTAAGTEIRLKDYRYDDAGRLVEVVNSSGRPTRFDYDHAGRVTAWYDRNGEWYRYTYNGAGRVVRTEGSGGFLAGTFDYDAENRTTRYTDSLGNTTTYHLNAGGLVERQVDPLGHVTTSEWDEANRLVRRTDPLGRTISSRYDEHGNLVALTRADGAQVLAEYSELHQATKIIDPSGATWRNEYDRLGNLVATVDPLGATTRFERDERGFLVSRTDAAGVTVRVTNDNAGLPVAMTESTGTTSRIQRDAFGRVAAVTDPAGGITRYEWTVEGRLLTRTQPDGAIERAVYDAEGNQVRHIDALGQETRSETTHFDLPLAEIRPDGSRMEISYDTELRPIVVTDSRGQAWHYEYDAVGRLTRETDFNGRTTDYRYDAAGQLVEQRDSAGTVVRFVRDPLGNVVERQSGDRSVTFEFDPMGRLARAVNADAELRYERDLTGRVLAETVNGRTVRSTYDLAGRRVRRLTPSGAESVWEFGAGGRPEALHTAGRTITFGYDNGGHEVERLLDSGTILAQAWDTADRLVSQTVSAVGGETTRARLIQQRRYHYRADGYVEGVEDHLAGTRRFDLDRLGQITTVHGSAGVERYSYDTSGNITAAAWPGPETDAQGLREYRGTQVEVAGNVRYRYDARGRVVTRQRKRLSAKPDTWQYHWDADDRLVGVITPDGTHWRYLYDPLNRRIAKLRLGAVGEVAERVDFAWDGAQLAEQTQDGVRSTSWDWNPVRFQPVTQVERVAQRPQEWIDEQFYSIVTDVIGTPAELIDAAGNLAWRSHTTVWGRALAQLTGHAGTPLRMPGQYFDAETGLHYNLNRFYDPETGRYQSADPLGLVPGPNPHAYVHNPVGVLDPSGLVEVCVNRWKEEREDHLAEIDWTHSNKVAQGVDYNYGRMDPQNPNNTPDHVRSHNLPDIGQDPHKMADYFRQFEGRGTHQEMVDGNPKANVRVSYDPERQVIIVENAQMIHGYRMSQADWDKYVQQGRYRLGT